MSEDRAPGQAPGPTPGQSPSPTPGQAPGADWQLKKPLSARLLLGLIAAALLLAWSFARMDLDRAVVETPDAVRLGVDFARAAWPVRLENARRVERMVQLGQMRAPGAAPPDRADRAAYRRWQGMVDPGDLPLFARIEDRPTQPHRADSPVEPYYVERFGYLKTCVWLMVDTIEMALWGTILAVILALPLGFFSARNQAHSPVLYYAARALCSLVRAIPELIVALILVIMYGPGQIAGILALGFHTSGFLGKFFADDVENAPPGPQEALRSTGAGRLAVLRIAVLPQVLPQYVAYIQYILERNVRTATILGVVGAGGIGFELMARFKNGEYDAVATILIIVFITVFALEHITQRLRVRLI